jgi:hypothetical protein
VGTGGRPLGTERSPAISSHASGAAFAREVARAEERAHGTPREEKRAAELEGERRASRRASFGRTRTPSTTDADAAPVEANFRSEHAPVAAQPAVATPSAAPSAPSELPLASPSSPEAAASVDGDAPPPNATTTSGAALTSPSTSPLTPATPPATPELGTLQAARTAEPEPRELAQLVRASAARGAKHAAAPSSAPAQDAAVLARAAEILRQIELFDASGVKRLTLELQPAELGRLAVQLALRERRVTAIVRAERAETLEALRTREGELMDVLARRGIAAEAVRFELGFGGSRSRGHARAAAAAELAHAPSTSNPATPPDDPPRASAPFDTFA